MFLINKALDYENPSYMELESGTVATSSMNKAHVDGASLWVDLYRPQRYMELLSDEGTNRILLRWLKLWDKVVFKRKPKFMMRQTDAAKSNSIKTNFKQSELNTNLDEHGFPEKKISLLCGPPGLGKTTLAHMIATHAGYNVVEVNASDDRTPAKFQELLKGATEMEAVIDPMKRPNCVIFDEIDGAPSASIDLLVKFVTGTAMSKKKKGEKKAHTLKRPIICICNDVYVPALRPLRQIAFIVNFPPTASSRLAERLSEIARHQNIKIDTGALLALCEKTENDIRSCLSALHFFKSLSKPITVTHVSNTSVGQKDMQKALFGVWQSIFQIQQSKMNQNHNEDNLYDGSLKHRMRNVLRIVNNFGDYDRLAQGVFENYPNLNNKNVPLSSTCEALEWFCFSDLLNTQIYTLQNYSLSPYLSYGFVVWHFLFGSLSRQKLVYPSANYEIARSDNETYSQKMLY